MMKRNFEYCESSVCQSTTSMHFWGVCCESGKQYAQVVGQRFRITMAVLDPNSFHNDESKSTVSLMVNRNGIEYLLCVLKHEEIQQVNLNLIFDKGENVKFYLNGHGKVCLSGYQLTDSEGDVLNDENGYLCPLVEVKSKSKKSNKDKTTEIKLSPVVSEVKTEFKSPTAKSKKKTKSDSFNLDDVLTSETPMERSLWYSFLNEFSGGEEDDDDSDEDFSVLDEEFISDSDDDEDEEETDDDIEEITTLNGDSSEEKMEIIQNSRGSRKRKTKVEVLPEKRSKNVSFKITSESPLEGSDGKDVSLQMNSAVCSTPVPEKKVISETVSSKKKSKKKKRKSEISNVSNNEHQTKSPIAASTSKSTYPVVKLNGGVEIQDIIVGKGPEAKVGKMLHVFYIGRFPDKSIFDSRVPAQKPFSFKLGTNQVIKGWDIGLVGMKAGGKRKIRVPPEMAYGKAGNDCIPPNVTLYFVVELNSVS